MLHLFAVAVAFHAVDLVSGLVCAVKRHDLKSSKLRDGFFKKLGFVLCYCLCALLDLYGHEVGLTLPFALLPAAVGFGVLTECSSILENCVLLSPWLAKLKIFTFLHSVNDKEDDEP